MALNIFSEDIDFEIDNPEIIEDWINRIIQNEKFLPSDINLIFASDDYLLDLNVKYLNHDYYTDVITFDYCEDNFVSGDIYISVDRVLDNSKLFDQKFELELHRIIVHGVLHLCGYKDKENDEKKNMTEKENFYLSWL